MPRELLFRLTKKNFILQTFRSGGKGGQNQNKRDTGVRIIHPASGARGESREERSQLINRKKAFERLAHSEKFKKWQKLEAVRILALREGRPSLEEQVAEDMRPENLRVEIQQDGRWVGLKDEVETI